MSIRRKTLTALATLGVLAGGLLCTGAPAFAKEIYLPDYSFGPGGPGAGAFSAVQGLAVNQASGNIYVYDANAGTVSKFTAAGEPSEFSALHSNVIEGASGGIANGAYNQLAIDESAGPASGDIYLANYYGPLAIFGSNGAALGQLDGGVVHEVPGAFWNTACGVAVDHSGDVYIGQYAGYVTKYTPVANPVRNANYTSALQGFSTSICNEAVDGEGHLYSQSGFGSRLERYSVSDFGSGSPATGTTIDGEGRGLTIDPASNDLFVAEQSGHVAQFDSSGNLVRRFQTKNGESYGVAVDSATHEVYVADNVSGQVDAYKLVNVTPPAVNDQAPAATAITRTTAGLSGTVNPQGYPTQYKFVYGPTSDYVYSTATLNAGAGSSDQSVGPVAIEGLTPGVTYHYALVATNPAGTVTGPDQTFTTAALTPPLLATGAPSEVTQTTATLTASVDAQGLAGTYGFELGTSAGHYGPRIGLGLLRAGAGAVAPALTLAGLEPGTTYHYRVSATNADGTSYGADQTFTTAVLASAAVSTPAGLPFLRVPGVAFPTETNAPGTKLLTTAQKLARALKACTKRPRAKRASCERQARRKYASTRKKGAKRASSG